MDLGEKLGVAGLALAVVAIFLPYVFKTMPWYVTYSGISIGVGILFFAALVSFLPPGKTDIISSSAAIQPAAAPSTTPIAADGLTSEERQFRAMREQRTILELAVKDVSGVPIKHEFEKSGMGYMEVASGSTLYRLAISISSNINVWIYSNSSPQIAKMAVVRLPDSVRGKIVDFRTLRPIRDSANISIGDRAFLEMVDGKILQIVLVGVLNYNSGDPIDEARFKYKVFEAGNFLIPSL